MAFIRDPFIGTRDLTTLVTTSISAVVAVFIFYFASYSIYSLYLHPLHTYPGPKLSAISRIPYWIASLKGDQVRWMIKLHRRYGVVVRFGPNDLSYCDGQAWKDIYTVPRGGKENGKEIRYHPPPANGIHNILSEPDRTRHAMMRRVFSPAFSEKALRAQEPLFRKYADLMVARGRQDKTVNLTELFNYVTFDIMADLALGQSLGLLETNEPSPWVATVFQAIRMITLVQMIEFYPLLKTVYDLVEPKFIAKMRYDHFSHTSTRVDKRLREGSEKQDIWSFVVESNMLTVGDMHINAELFMTAGTETSASLLTGLTYYLIANPDKMKKLTSEIRGRFSSSADLTFEALAGLSYLNACLREGLRVYPSVPSGIPREIAEGGNVVLGKWLPAGTRVAVNQTATFRSPENFRNPDRFAPERWLGDPEYDGDNREAHQPFSAGPRNCLGMNAAWHEMRMVLAKLLFNFDIESDVGPEWREQDVYITWDRKPLICHLKYVAS